LKSRWKARESIKCYAQSTAIVREFKNGVSRKPKSTVATQKPPNATQKKQSEQ